MENCIFCKIISGQLPSYKVYEDDNFLGFLDIYPRAKGDTLLIPKTHYRWVYDVPEFSDYWQAALKISKAMQKTLNPSFINYFTFGLDIFHAHIHITPRKNEKQVVPPIITIPPEEMKKIAEIIRKELL